MTAHRVLSCRPETLLDAVRRRGGPDLRSARRQLSRQSVEPCDDLRDLLLPKLVTGQIDVSELDLDALVEEAAA